MQLAEPDFGEAWPSVLGRAPKRLRMMPLTGETHRAVSSATARRLPGANPSALKMEPSLDAAWAQARLATQEALD